MLLDVGLTVFDLLLALEKRADLLVNVDIGLVGRLTRRRGTGVVMVLVEHGKSSFTYSGRACVLLSRRIGILRPSTRAVTRVADLRS